MNYKEKIYLIVVLAVFLLQAVTSMRLKSPTWDEPSYLGLGYYILTTGKWDVPASTLHPPLTYYLNSIPYLFYDADETAWEIHPSLKGEHVSNVSFPLAGLNLLADQRFPQDRVLFWSRIPTVLLALLLGIFVWKWTRELYGSLPAAVALLFFSFSPTILAHSRLITPDMALTCFTFVSVYYFRRVFKYGSWGSIVLCSLFSGLTLLSKYSGLLLLPIFFLLLILVFSSREEVMIPYRFPCRDFLMRNGRFSKIARLGSVFLVVTALATVVVCIGYMFHLDFYVKGALHQIKHAEGGHPAFLMGMYSSQGWWYYTLIAFVIKTPLPLLLLLTASFIFHKTNPRGSFLDQAFLLVPVLAFFLFFSSKLLCIGLRYVLPVYPFLFVQASMVAGCRLNDKTSIIKGAVAGLGVWYLLSSFLVYPHYLAFFNSAVGGPDNGYKYLVDSNLDWGQDLKGLGKYMKVKGIDKVHLSYFGTADPAYYDIDYQWMPSYYLPEEFRGITPRDYTFAAPQSGIVAISATNLQGVYFSDKKFYDWLKKYDPIDKIGYSIFIYDLDQP
jgi:4-amino-4-deoxy-L-arabinose transferase-like glycosyltransferase